MLKSEGLEGSKRQRCAGARRMKIGFLIPSLGIGGAERVATILCDEWTKLGHEVHLLTYFHDSECPSYEPGPDVYWCRLDIGALRSVGLGLRNLIRVLVIRRQLQRIAPDVLICFLTEANVLGIVAAAGLRIPVLVSERIHPARHPIGIAREILRRVAYRWADGLIVQSESIALWCRENWKLHPVILPNPVRIPQDFQRDDGREQIVVAIGRLERQKGLDTLISAFAVVADQYPDWRMEIYGEGSERMALERQIRALSMSGRIELKGIVHDVDSRLRRAEIYCHAARYEGFPNALVEALANGCCVVAVNSPGAVAEILAGGKYGLLAAEGSVVDLQRQLISVLESAELRARLRANARDAILALNAPVVARRWLRLLQTRVSG